MKNDNKENKALSQTCVMRSGFLETNQNLKYEQ